MAIDTREKRASAISIPGLVPLPLADSTIGTSDRPHIAWVYSGITYTPEVVSSGASSTGSGFEVHIFDQYGNLAKVLTNQCEVDWEYNRIGGCGQCNVRLLKNYDFYSAIKPKSSVKIYIDGQLRYTGKLIKIARSVSSGLEKVELIFYGYLSDLDKLIVREEYTNEEVSLIVKDILDDYILPYSDITYVSSDIEATDYSVGSLNLNHSAKDALKLLAEIGGDVEWGVDRNKRFYFKRTDPNIKRVYVLGREVTNYIEETNTENVVNVINMFGANGSLITTMSASLSVNVYGTRQDNVFESSISEQSDASRYGAVLLKKLSTAQRSAQFMFVTPDTFIEVSTPLGATAVNSATFSGLKKYGRRYQYGTRNKYGNIKRDQVANIRYNINQGGMSIAATLQADIPNMGDSQKRIEFELKEVQRR